MEVVVTTGVIRLAKPQSNQHPTPPYSAQFMHIELSVLQVPRDLYICSVLASVTVLWTYVCLCTDCDKECHTIAQSKVVWLLYSGHRLQEK